MARNTLRRIGEELFKYYKSLYNKNDDIYLLIDEEDFKKAISNVKFNNKSIVDDYDQYFIKFAKSTKFPYGAADAAYIALAIATFQVKIISDFEGNDDTNIAKKIDAHYKSKINNFDINKYFKDQSLIWSEVSNLFKNAGYNLSLPNDLRLSGPGKNVQYPKHHRLFKASQLVKCRNELFDKVNENKNNLRDVLEREFGKLSDVEFRILKKYYESRSLREEPADKDLYIKIKENKIIETAGEIFNRQFNKIHPERGSAFRLFISDTDYWWKSVTGTDFPENDEFLLLIDASYTNEIESLIDASYTNEIESLVQYRIDFSEYTDEYILLKFPRKVAALNNLFPAKPKLEGGVRLYNNQYLRVPGMEPKVVGNSEYEKTVNGNSVSYRFNDGYKLSYTFVAPKENKDEDLTPVNIINGLELLQNDFELNSSVSVKKKTVVKKLSPKLSPEEEAVIKCQQALYLWFAYKGKVSHQSVNNICAQLVENFDILKKMSITYPEFYIFQPLFKLGIIDLYKDKNNHLYYSLATNCNAQIPSIENEYSYRKHFNKNKCSSDIAKRLLKNTCSLVNEFYTNDCFFEKIESFASDTPVYIRHSVFRGWSRKDDNTWVTTFEKLYGNPALFKTEKESYGETYFTDGTGAVFKLRDAMALWYPYSWNICETFIDFHKKGRDINSLMRLEASGKLIINDFNSLPINIARALAINNPAILKEDAIWLSYYHSIRGITKTQDFSKVDNELYELLESNIVEERDTHPTIIKTDENTFSFKIPKEKYLASEKSYKIFRYQVGDPNLGAAWISYPDYDGIPQKRPFGILVDASYYSNDLSKSDRIYLFVKEENGRKYFFLYYKRLPDDFFNVLNRKKYNIKTAKNDAVIDISNIKREVIKPEGIDGIRFSSDTKLIEIYKKIYSFDDSLYCDITAEAIRTGYLTVRSSLDSNMSIDANINCFSAEVLKELLNVKRIENIRFDSDNHIIEFTVKDVRRTQCKTPIERCELWKKLINSGAKPWEEPWWIPYRIENRVPEELKYLENKTFKVPFNLEVITECLQTETSSVDSENKPSSFEESEIFELQEKLYNWLKEVGSADISEVHEFLMQCLENSKNFRYYGLNPETKILNAMIFTGIVDPRINSDDNKTYYCLSEKDEFLPETSDLTRIYQNHFIGGDESRKKKVTKNGHKYLVHLLSAIDEVFENSPKYDEFEKEKNFFIYNVEKKELMCRDVSKLPWQLARALFMIDTDKLIQKKSYLCCSSYEARKMVFSNMDSVTVIVLDNILFKLIQEREEQKNDK